MVHKRIYVYVLLKSCLGALFKPFIALYLLFICPLFALFFAFLFAFFCSLFAFKPILLLCLLAFQQPHPTRWRERTC